MQLRYKEPAPNTQDGWEKYSLPIGNGYAGASIFGGTDTERIHFTTNFIANPYEYGGVSNFAEIQVFFSPGKTEAYERGLTFDDGVVYSKYRLNGKDVLRRSYFSYVDRAFVYTVSGIDSFVAELVIPFLGMRDTSEGGREGRVEIENKTVVMRGKLPLRNLLYEGRMFVKTDGEVSVEHGKIRVSNATESAIIFILDTSYKLCNETFLEGNHEALGKDPHEALCALETSICKLTERQLYERHKDDYAALMGRVCVKLGGKDDGRATDELLHSYKAGNREAYLEELYYAYGRHLLICSSRTGTPPASLQGVWSAYDKSPWGCGFWHNINVQMNYWHAFSSNLTECFEAYADFWMAYLKQAEIHASQWVQDTNPENYVEGEGACGWIIGTGAFCYEIEGRHPHQHSGPGTGGLTSKLFWDYYDFTRDEEILQKYTFPAIHGMGKFLTKVVRAYDDRYLCNYSASPEQILSGGIWIDQHAIQQYYHTVGCAFDQQMICENARDDLRCAETLHFSDEITKIERKQLGGYNAVQVGYSGQIKEYDEEHFYGEIGDAKHRHISQLVALMPGTQITRQTPAWLDSAKETLRLRGDKSTGWALAHRLCAWARTGDGNKAYQLLGNLLKTCTYPNLWDVHPPFQIDGNFGGVAGMTEMLLQSHDGCITLLPAIPDEWDTVSFTGLKARGNFTIDCEYAHGTIRRIVIVSAVGGKVRLRMEKIAGLVVKNNEKNIPFHWENSILCFDTNVGGRYEITGFSKRKSMLKISVKSAEWGSDCVRLQWETLEDAHYAIYCAIENAPEYTLLATTDADSYCDERFNKTRKARLTYKIVAYRSGEAEPTDTGAVVFLHPASALEKERYALRFKQNNINNG